MLNNLEGEALESYLKEITAQNPYQMAVYKLVQDIKHNIGNRLINRKLISWILVSSLSVMRYKMRTDFLPWVVKYLNSIKPQLVNGFHAESN